MNNEYKYKHFQNAVKRMNKTLDKEIEKIEEQIKKEQ